jgi:hypothetical protein
VKCLFGIVVSSLVECRDHQIDGGQPPILRTPYPKAPTEQHCNHRVVFCRCRLCACVTLRRYDNKIYILYKFNMVLLLEYGTRSGHVCRSLNKTHPSTQQGGISCVVVVAGLILDLEHKKVKTIMPAELCHCPSELGYIEFRHARKQGISKGWTQRAKKILLCAFMMKM